MKMREALRQRVTNVEVIVGLALVLVIAAAVKGWPPNFQPLVAVTAGILLGGAGYKLLNRRDEHVLALAISRAAGAGPLPPGMEAMVAHADPELLSLVLHDGRRFVMRDASYQQAGRPPTWVEFEAFVRQTLKERLGADNVQLYQVSDDGEYLLPMQDAELRPDQLLSAREGRLGAAVSSGRISLDMPVGGSADAPTAQHDSWLMPLRSQGRTTGLVRVQGWQLPPQAAAQLVGQLREALEFVWHTVFALQRQAFAERSEHTRGVLTRRELLTMLDRRVREAQLNGRALTVLLVHVEGAASLEQQGLWPEHDAILGRIGEALQNGLPAGAAVGRLTDQDFLMLLRDAQDDAGSATFENLLRAGQAAAAAALEQCAAQGDVQQSRPRLPLWLRGGLATLAAEGNMDWQPSRPNAENSDLLAPIAGVRSLSPAARRLVRRGLGLVAHACRTGAELTRDVDSGIPQELRRTVHADPHTGVLVEVGAAADPSGAIEPDETT